MANIEKRRIQRKTVMILIAAGAVLTVGAMIALLIVFLPRSERKDAAVPTEPAPTQSVTTAPAEEPSFPAVTYTPLPEDTSAPVRVSDDMSVMILSVRSYLSTDENGAGFRSVSGSAALVFVNNTDRALCSADLFVGDLIIDCVTLNGSAAGFSVSESGFLTIPFLNELQPDESCEMFFSFSAELYGDVFTVPYFSYDTSYELRMTVRTDERLDIPGAIEKTVDDGFLYETEGEAVTRFTVTFPS